MDKLRLSALDLCVLGCFFGLEFEGVCALRLLYGREATFNVDAMLKLLSEMGAAVFGGRFCFAWVLVFQFGRFEDFCPHNKRRSRLPAIKPTKLTEALQGLF